MRLQMASTLHSLRDLSSHGCTAQRRAMPHARMHKHCSALTELAVGAWRAGVGVAVARLAFAHRPVALSLARGLLVALGARVDLRLAPAQQRCLYEGAQVGTVATDFLPGLSR